MASTDSRPVPKYNTAFRVYFGFFKNDGTLITSPSSITARVIQDGSDGAANGTPTQVGTTGVYYLDLLSTEMDTDCTVVKVSDSTTGSVPVVIPLYPQNSGDIRADVDTIGGDATAATNAYRAFSGMKIVTISSGSTSTSITTDLTEVTNDQYKGRPLYFITGALAGEIVEITAYNGTTKALTVTATPTGESPAQNDIALIA